MFKSVGGYECGLNENFNINGENWNCITKDIAFLEYERNNRNKIVGAMDKVVEIISRKSKNYKTDGRKNI